MATVKVIQRGARQFGGPAGVFGNTTILRYALKTASNGGAVGADSSAALASGDVVDLGQLPEGFSLDDALIVVTTGMTATITGKLGFKYEDGVNVSSHPQDDAFFGSSLNLATAGRVRSTGSKAPFALPKPARLILTTAVADNAKISDLTVLVQGELTGAR